MPARDYSATSRQHRKDREDRLRRRARARAQVVEFPRDVMTAAVQHPEVLRAVEAAAWKCRDDAVNAPESRVLNHPDLGLDKFHASRAAEDLLYLPDRDPDAVQELQAAVAKLRKAGFPVPADWVFTVDRRPGMTRDVVPGTPIMRIAAEAERLIELAEFEGKNREPVADNEPLPKGAREVLELLRGLPPGAGLTGAKIIEALDKQGVFIDQSRLTSDIIPVLKEHHTVKNKPRLGYYIDRQKTGT